MYARCNTHTPLCKKHSLFGEMKRKCIHVLTMNKAPTKEHFNRNESRNVSWHITCIVVINNDLNVIYYKVKFFNVSFIFYFKKRSFFTANEALLKTIELLLASLKAHFALEMVSFLFLKNCLFFLYISTV
jgi:hypothetical protein